MQEIVKRKADIELKYTLDHGIDKSKTESVVQHLDNVYWHYFWALSSMEIPNVPKKSNYTLTAIAKSGISSGGYSLCRLV